MPSAPTPDLHGSAQPDGGYSGGSYIWLAYSVFFFIDPFFSHDSRLWAKSLVIYTIFLALYVLYVQIPRRTLRLCLVAGIFLLGAVAFPINPGASTLFVYVAALLPFTVESMAVVLSVMIAESLFLFGEGRFFAHDTVSFYITPFFILVVGGSNIFVAQQKRNDCKLRRAQQENVALAGLAERERIARDLHDVLGHTLSVIVLKAELAGRLLGRDDVRAAAEIADVERTARTALAEVREAIGGYRSKGLTAEIEHARSTLRAAGVNLLCESAPPVLRASEETVLSLALREAVTNIVRHAGATRCTLRFTRTRDGFDALIIEDDGQGTATLEGNGLRGMRERIAALGGRFHIASDAGTRLLIELPADPSLPAPRPAHAATLSPLPSPLPANP